MKKFSVNKIKKYIADRQKLKSDKAPWTERWALTKKLWKQQMIRGGQRWYSDKVKYLQSMIDKKREQIKKESKKLRKKGRKQEIKKERKRGEKACHPAVFRLTTT